MFARHTHSLSRGLGSHPAVVTTTTRSREEEGARPRVLRLRAASRQCCSGSAAAASSSSLKSSPCLSLSLPERTAWHGRGRGPTVSSRGSNASKLNAVAQVLWSNTVFKVGFIAWLAAQVLKVFTSYISTRSLDWRPLFDSGGMPSSHSSLCMGVTTAVAVLHGLGSSLFPICLGFSCIVMYDAANVRLQAGKHAQILNAIVKTERGKGLDLDLGLKDLQLKEVLGHSKIQVMCGAILGVVVGLVVK